MENRKGSGIFLSVIGVATLIVAIIGATFAYFSATAAGDNVVNVASTKLELGYSDVTTRLNTNMIPTTNQIAQFAAFNEDWVNQETVQYQIPGDANEDGKIDEGETITTTVTGAGECIDDNGNEICSVYEFYIGNPSTTTNMNIEGRVNVVKNEFTNLHYMIFDEAGNAVTGDEVFPTETEGTKDIPELSQQLLANPNVETRLGENTVPGFELVAAFDADKPNTYNPLVAPAGGDTALKGKTNVRHYTMLIWIHETGGDQTDADSGKIFSAGIAFDTGGDSGVTGMIAVANGTKVEAAG